MDSVKPGKQAVTETTAPSAWVLYLLECENGSYYAGITTDLERRFAEHVFGVGARYTRANPPQRVIAAKLFADRASASRAEARLKKLPRSQKVDFFATLSPETKRGRARFSVSLIASNHPGGTLRSRAGNS